MFDIMGSDRVGHKPVCPHLHLNSDKHNLAKHKRKEGKPCLHSPLDTEIVLDEKPPNHRNDIRGKERTIAICGQFKGILQNENSVIILFLHQFVSSVEHKLF